MFFRRMPEIQQNSANFSKKAGFWKSFDFILSD